MSYDNANTVRRLGYVACAGVLGVSLTACGGSGGGPSTTDGVTSGPRPQVPDGATNEGGSGGMFRSPETGADCYVQLFDGDHFDETDRHFTLTEPGRYADLKNLPGADSDWTDEADSLKVGSGATVTIWTGTDFQGESQTLNPGSAYPDNDVEPASLKLSC